MKLLKTAIIIFLFFFRGKNACAQLDAIVSQLSKKKFSLPINIIKEPTGTHGTLYFDSLNNALYLNSTGYYFQQFDSLASDEQLIALTNHDSTVIQAYAAYALGSRDTSLLPGVLQKMLDANHFVYCNRGCFHSNEPTALMLFDGLNKRKRESGFPTNAFIDLMDSIFLSHKNAEEYDIEFKLLRRRSPSLTPVIAKLAFERKSFSAVSYLYNWYKGEYYEQINKVYLELLDSNMTRYSTPLIVYIIPTLINMRDEQTLKKLGHWLKFNREKWVGLNKVDSELDESWEVKDSIGSLTKRYPIDKGSADFLLHDWLIISGMNINELKIADTIVLEQKAAQKINHQKLSFEFHTDKWLYGDDDAWLFMYYYSNSNDKKPKIVGTPILDSKNRRICLEASDKWDWYKITIKGKGLLLVREQAVF